MPHLHWVILLCLGAMLNPLAAHGQAFVWRGNQILKINPETGGQTLFFTATSPERVNDVIAHGTNALLAVLHTRTLSEEEESIYASRIVSIALTNAHATEVFLDYTERAGPLSITIADDGTLYAAAAGEVFLIDLEAGLAVPLTEEPLDETTWGIFWEPAGTLLLGIFDYMLRFDPDTGLAEEVDTYGGEITWFNCAVAAPDGTLYFAADNEHVMEVLPSGARRTVTAGGYMGVDDSGPQSINSAITGLAWLNTTQLMATVVQYFAQGWPGFSSTETRLIWIDLNTGQQHLISEKGWLDRVPDQTAFSGLARLGQTAPRTAAPRLEATRLEFPDLTRQLKWSAPGYVLQSSTNLTSTNGWANVPSAPTAYAGEARYNLPLTNAHHFFRLKKMP